VRAKPVNLNRKLRALAGIAIAAVVFGLLLPKALPFVRIGENWLYDARVGYLTPARASHPDIVLVLVTEDTLAQFPFRSPLNRRFFGDLVKHLTTSGVRAIGIDSIFDQPTIPEDDLYLHQIIRNSKTPIIVGEAAPQTYQTETQRAFQQAFLEVLNSAYVNVLTDGDGTVRQAYRGQDGPDGWKPGLADAVAGAAGTTAPPGVRPISYYPALEGDKIYKAFRSFAAHDALLLPPAWFKDKIVLIGAELTLEDRLLTPFSRTTGKISGIYVHAFALAQILDNRHITAPGLYLQIALLVLLSVIGVALAVVSWPLYLRWGGIVLVLAACWGAVIWLYRFDGYMIPLIAPTLSLILSVGLATIYLGYQERQQRRFLRDAFSRYVSPNLVDDIIKTPEQLELEGSRRYLTFIFTDLAGFTSLAEQLDPADIVGLLNGYIDGMCAIVFRHGGTVDKIVGDAVAAYWGAPIDQEDQRARAVACALEMDTFAEDYRRRNVTKAGLLGLTRIGINSGTAIIGNFGGDTFFDYTAHGDMVNTAARLEGANKYLGTRICVGEEARKGCPDQAFRSVGALILKGKSEAINVFEPVNGMDQETLALFEEAYHAMDRGEAQALDLYRNLNTRFPGDPVAKLHTQRLQAGETGTVITMAGK
jgi:adenylate cyclase